MTQAMGWPGVVWRSPRPAVKIENISTMGLALLCFWTCARGTCDAAMVFEPSVRSQTEGRSKLESLKRRLEQVYEIHNVEVEV